MLGYWPDASCCAIVVDAYDRMIVMLRWSDPSGATLPPLPEAARAPAAIHLVVFDDRGSPIAPGSGLPGAVCHGVPVGHVLRVARDGARVAWALWAPGDEGPAISAGVLSPDDVARIAARWGVPPWVACREEYVADIAVRPELRDAVSREIESRQADGAGDADEQIIRVLECLAATADAHGIAAILTALADKRVRDTVLWELMRMEAPVWALAADRLAQAVGAAPEGHVAPAATLLSILRWQLGDGTRAIAAVERALDCDPSYSLAALVDRCLESGMHPQVWRQGLEGLTREECRGVA